jgi:trigger factor
MNVVVEELDHCEILLRVDLPTERVDAEWKKITNSFAQQARLPGFRPGKAPRSMIESRYAKEIEEELKSSLVRTALGEAVREKKLEVLSVSKVEEVELGVDRTFRFAATVVIRPAFALPDYNNLNVTVDEPKVGEEEVTSMLDRLREPHANYNPIEGRGLVMGDYAVITYESKLDGQALKEALPSSPPMLQGRSNFWVEMKTESFLPRFCEELVGLETGQSKTFTLTLPPDFPHEELAGKSLEFAVTLEAINEKVLPEWDDELAGKIAPGKSLDEVRSLVKENLQDVAQRQLEQSKRSQALNALMAQVTCHLPRQMIQQQTMQILQDIVEENQGRGVSEDELREHQDELVGSARQSAEQRVRGRFILLRIAEQEKIKVEDQEVLTAIMEMSTRFQIPVKKLVKDLQRRDAIGGIREDILARKAMDLLAGKVVVRPAEG